jgi:hypothetical protein
VRANDTPFWKKCKVIVDVFADAEPMATAAIAPTDSSAAAAFISDRCFTPTPPDLPPPACA